MDEIPSEKPDWHRDPPIPERKAIPGGNGGTLHPGDWGQGKLGGRPKGTKNRATILKHFMNLRITQQVSLTGETKTLPLESHMELEMLAAILQDRNIQAYKEVKDTLYGKLKETVEHSGEMKSVFHLPQNDLLKSNNAKIIEGESEPIDEPN